MLYLGIPENASKLSIDEDEDLRGVEYFLPKFSIIDLDSRPPLSTCIDFLFLGGATGDTESDSILRRYPNPNSYTNEDIQLRLILNILLLMEFVS